MQQFGLSLNSDVFINDDDKDNEVDIDDDFSMKSNAESKKSDRATCQQRAPPDHHCKVHHSMVDVATTWTTRQS